MCYSVSVDYCYDTVALVSPYCRDHSGLMGSEQWTNGYICARAAQALDTVTTLLEGLLWVAEESRNTGHLKRCFSFQLIASCNRSSARLARLHPSSVHLVDLGIPRSRRGG